MNDWNDIKEQIRETQEPLSPHAWSDMQGKLERGGKGGWKLVTGVFLIGLLMSAVIIGKWSGNEEYYQAREVSNEVPGEAVYDFESKVQNQDAGTTNETGSERGGAEDVNKSYPAKESAGRTNDPYGVAGVPDGTSEDEEGAGQQKDFYNNEFQHQNAHAQTQIIDVPVQQPEPKGLHNLIDSSSVSVMDFSNSEGPVQVVGAGSSSRLEMRAYFGMTYNIANLEYSNNSNQTHKQFEEAINNAVKPGWGYDAGVELRYRLFRNFMISSGIGIRQIVTENNYNYQVNEVPVIDSATGNILGYFPLANPMQYGAMNSNTYTFMDIPLSLFYEQPLGGRWSMTGEAINHISILINQTSTSINPTTLELGSANDDLFNNVVNAYQFRLGLRYQVNENVFLALEPAYRGYYQDFFKSESITWKPSDFSINIAAIIIFNNYKSAE